MSLRAIQSSAGRSICLIAFIALLAAVVRIWAALGEFWVDEILSILLFVRGGDSPWDAFTQHHDNNHILNTLWMFVCGPNVRNWFWYRLPSIVAGVATVPLAARFAWRWGQVASVAAALLTASSFVLVTYASEARGYALAGCFVLLGMIALDDFYATRGWRACAWFAVTAVLALLAHLSVVMYYAGAVAWSAVALFRRRQSTREWLVDLARLHVLPCAAIGFLALFHVRNMTIAAGTHSALGDVAGRVAALALGSDATVAHGVVIASIAVAGLFAVAIARLCVARDDVWVFFLVAILLAPLALFDVRKTHVLYERYFYVNLLLFLLLAASLVAWLWRVHSAGRWLAAAALTAFVVANGSLNREFLQYGRGHFSDAFHYLAEHATESDIRVATDSLLINQIYLIYYADYLPADRQITFYEDTRELAAAPEWLFISNSAKPYEAASELYDAARTPPTQYVLVRAYPFAGLSGFNCAVYRRADLVGWD